MFRRFFAGRNGADHITLAVTIAAMLVGFLVPRIGSFPLGTVISLLFVAYAVFRMMSKNVARRRAENAKFVAVLYRIKNWFAGIGRWFKRTSARAKDNKTHRVFKCSECGQKLRVPRGRGKISITCSKCGHKFIKKT